MSIRPQFWSLAAATFCLSIAGGAHAQITATSSSTGVSCHGGSNGVGTVTPSGGVGPYTYTWVPRGGTAATASALEAGTYNVTISDGTTSIVQPVTISEPDAFNATVTKTDVTSAGAWNGTATVTPSGATAPYSYSWSPSGGTGATATGLAEGTYSVTITDTNSCVYMAGATIAVAAPPPPTPTTTNVAVPANGVYATGQSLDFTVNFDQSVTVTGTPFITLMVGASPVQAQYVSGSGTASLVFRYVVQAGDMDANGVTVGSINLNGGTIRNAGNANAVITLNNVGSTSGVLVSAPASPAAVPTLTEWAMILLTGLLALFGAARLGFLPAARKD